MRRFSAILSGFLYVLTRPLVLVGRALRRVATSFRFWVLAILAVLLVLVVYYALVERYTPLTTDAYVQAFVIQVAPQVAGQVIRVHVHEGEQVQAGRLLFELDPRPFEHKVAYLEAKQVEAAYQVRQLSAELAAARAEHARMLADADYAASVHRQERQIFRTESTTERRYLESVQKNKASQAAVDQAAAGVQKIEDALDARITGEHTLIAQVKAQLAEARLNLAYTRVVAPCDGIITDLQLRDGAYVHIGQAAMTVIDSAHWLVVGNFRENSLLRMRPGQPALVAFRSAPGRLWPARVSSVGWGVGRGQGVPSGMLPEVKTPTSWVPRSQRFQVRLALDPAEAVPLRVGMTGSVSVYTEAEGLLNDITRAWHQFISWWDFL